MTARQGVLIGCGVSAAVALVVGVGIVVVFVIAAQDPKGVAVTIHGPERVTVGKSFDLTVEICNERPKKPFGLSDIDINEDYLDGFTIVSTSPTANSSMHVPLDNSRSFNFDQTIAAGETRRFTFKLRAETSGMFRGDVDVCEGMRYLSQMAQTVVEEAQ